MENSASKPSILILFWSIPQSRRSYSSMAASSSLSNFLSFLLPTKPPPPKTPPPQQFNPPPPPSSTGFQSQSQKFHDKSPVPLISHDNDRSSSSSSSLSPELSSVICPSLAFSNTLFFSSGYNVQVIVDENEPEERLLSRFRREVMKAGVIQECKRRMFFENKQDEKKRKSREAAKRNRRRRPMSRNPLQNRQEPQATKKEEDDDNWDLPEDV